MEDGNPEAHVQVKVVRSLWCHEGVSERTCGKCLLISCLPVVQLSHGMMIPTYHWFGIPHMAKSHGKDVRRTSSKMGRRSRIVFSPLCFKKHGLEIPDWCITSVVFEECGNVPSIDAPCIRVLLKHVKILTVISNEQTLKQISWIKLVQTQSACGA